MESMDSGHILEATTTTLEWKVTGLKKLFDSSKGDAKSKVTRSVKFGGGKWQILFYPNSGTDGGAHLSLYLSCEPTVEEKEKASLDGKWVREGKFKFNFELCTIGKSTMFNRKEACDHSFNYKTANWGWAQFARRDAVYYNSSIVRQADAFLVLCEISCSAAPPSPSPQTPVQTVPKSLMSSIGDLLNNPLYSDVEFVFPSRNRNKPTRRIYAMKALLTRADYFSSLLESGFAEGKTHSEAAKRNDEMEDVKVELDEIQTAHMALTSSISTYDSDFDDESDTEQDDGSDEDAESATSEMQTEVALEISVSEESTLAPTDPQNDNTNTATMEGVQDVNKEDTLSENDSTGLTTRLAPSWQSSNASDASLPENLSVVTDSQPAPQIRRVPVKLSNTVPGPPKVRIEVKDVAYRTYLAMLHYIYTDNIIFAPLASTFSKEDDKRASLLFGKNTEVPATASSVVFEQNAATTRPKSPAHGSQSFASRKEWLAVWHANNSQVVGPCSAKAVYQLADKLNLLELKARAFKHIIRSMTVQNIPHEMFSSFSAKFEEVRKVQLDYFLTNWGSIRSSDAMASIWQQIRGGKHPGFEEVWPRIAMNLVFKPQIPPMEAEEAEVA